jgi:hypothetical protein
MNAKKLFVILLAAVAVLAGGFAPAFGQPAQPFAIPPGETAIVRVYYPDDAMRIAVYLGFEPSIYETNYKDGYHIMQVSQPDLDRLLALGLRVERDTEWTPPPVVPVPEGAETIPGYSCYRTVEETYAAAQALVTNHPTLASWSDVGDSWDKATAGGAAGYDMMVLKLTNSAVTGDKPDLFITASVHAREYTPAETATRFAEYLVNGYGTDPDATWILDHHEIHVMPQGNPDGRKYAEGGASWRKNTRNNCSTTPPSTGDGTDLNRNFAFKWGCCGGSSGVACAETYRGPTAGSEPETQAIQAYMAALFPDQRGPLDTDAAPANATGLYIDLHSSGELVLWPWGWTSTDSPNHTQHQTLGRKLAYFNNHTPQKSYTLYPTDGTTDDHSYGVFGVASYCIEMGTAFFQSCTTYESTTHPTNLQALIYAAKVPRTPYMTPLGPDARSLGVSPAGVPAGEPVALMATIDDTRYRSGYGEPVQAIAAAEYYVDVPPWQSGAVAHTMAAADGSFRSTIEGVTATVDTTGLSDGTHLLFVRGQDANGNWGAFTAVFLEITAPNTWTGAAGTNWSTPGNWSRGSVPDSTCSSDVLIPGGLTNYPVLTAESWVRGLTIEAGAGLDGGAQTLHVCGNWRNSGTFDAGSGTVNFMGTTAMSGGSAHNDFYHVTISQGKSLDLGGEALQVSGDWTDYGGTVTPNTSSLVFQGGTQAGQKADGTAPAVLLSDDMESGTAKWSHAAAQGTDAWALSTAQSHSATHSWLAPDVSSVTDTRLWNTAAVLVDATSTLTFWQRYAFEGSTSTCYDGSVLEISTDGGATWSDLGQKAASGGYNGTINCSYQNPLCGRSAWCSDLTTWTQVSVPLGSYAGQSAQVRWRLGCDSGVSDTGWYIDDVAISGTATVPTTLAFHNLTIQAGSTTTFHNDAAAAGAYLIQPGAFHEMEENKIAGGTSFTYLGGTLSNYETRPVAGSEVTFYDGRSAPTAKITKTAGTNADATVTTHMGRAPSADPFGDTCPAFPNAVQRYYHIVPATTGWTATVSLHYEDGTGGTSNELNGNAESTLKVYHCKDNAWHEQGTATVDTANNWVTVAGVDDFSPFALANGSPTSVDLARFEAWPEGAAVHVQWETAQEIDNLGFNLYRSNTRSGPKAKLNAQLIPTQVPPGSPFGAVYDWIDGFRIRTGRAYFYWLEDVDLQGTATMHGPVRVRVP